MIQRRPYDPVTDYAQKVTRGSLMAGPMVRLACQRHLNDLKHGSERGLEWFLGGPDDDGAIRVITWFQNYLHLSSGQHEGKPFVLHPSQEFIIGSLFGWKAADGTRRFRVAYVEQAKGSGKSPCAAGLGLYMLVGDREPRAEVYAAAVDYDQAQILFRDAIAMRNASPELRALLSSSGGTGREWNLADLETGSFFRPIASDHKGTGKSGPRVHCALLDEVHEHPTRAMVEYMRAGTKGRRQALIFMITNSGFDRTSVCWDYHKMSERILRGELQNDAFFAYVCGLDKERKVAGKNGKIEVIPGDDWRDERCWIKANPLLDTDPKRDQGIPGYKYLREQVREAEGMPSKQSIVQRLNFCSWTEGESFWLGQEIWEAVQAQLEIKDYFGRKAYAAIDISSKRDLTALALNIPLDDGSSAAFVWFFMPEDGVRTREDRDGVSYGLWREQGYIETTSGPVVDLAVIADRLMSLSQDIEIAGLACDTYRRDQLQIELDNIDCPIPIIEHPQGFRKALNSEIWMPRSVEKTEERIVKRMVHINTNPCLTWNASSVVMTEDAQGNKKPDKKKAAGRIDGVVALIEAIGISDSIVVQPKPSYNFFVLTAPNIS
jgi:phage terminase large subunit-like protein